MQRLLTTTISRNGGPEQALCGNSYDELGRLASQQLGSSAKGQVGYAHNVRGWVTSVDSKPYFSQTLRYEDAGGTGATPCFNGNICSNEWEQRDAIIADTTANHRYNYSYDALNRLTAAKYSDSGNQSWNGSLILGDDPDWSTSYSYDLGGNITGIKRKGASYAIPVFDNTAWGFGLIDDVTLQYDGNRLMKADDKCDELTYAGAMDFKDRANKSEEYTYDANGNMTSDQNRGITRICYNTLNLPEEVDFADGHITRYTYAADGRKLRTQYLVNPLAVVPDPVDPREPTEPIIGPGLLSNGQTTVVDTSKIEHNNLEQVLTTVDYCANYIYRNGRLEQVLNDYGYADSTGTLCFYIKDYQGNVRAVIDNDGKLLETNSYYPYGMLRAGGNASAQSRKYGTKELDREHGLDLYDSQARWYDPTTGKTTTQDPLAEEFYPMSPYLWCGGNPVSFIDPLGLDTINVSFANEKWSFTEPIMADGADVFNITVDGNTTSYCFSEGEYGERVDALNIEIKDDYALGIYHISGEKDGGTGFYVVPGGSPSKKVGSGRRIPDGNYPILPPFEGAQWQQPQVGGIVADRGIRFHYGYPIPIKWTEGCFVLSTDYLTNNGQITFNKESSLDAVRNFDRALGGGDLFLYKTKKGKLRQGSHFPRPIRHKLYLRSIK